MKTDENKNTFDTKAASILPPDESRIKGFYLPNSRDSIESVEAWARELSHIFADAICCPTAVSGMDAYTGALIDWYPLPVEEVDMINELVFDYIKQNALFALPSTVEAEDFVMNICE